MSRWRFGVLVIRLMASLSRLLLNSCRCYTTSGLYLVDEARDSRGVVAHGLGAQHDHPLKHEGPAGPVFHSPSGDEHVVDGLEFVLGCWAEPDGRRLRYLVGTFDSAWIFSIEHG